MQIVITIDREPGASSVGISSTFPAIFVVRDPSTTNAELLATYASILEDLRTDMPQILDADAVEVPTQ